MTNGRHSRRRMTNKIMRKELKDIIQTKRELKSLFKDFQKYSKSLKYGFWARIRILFMGK